MSFLSAEKHIIDTYVFDQIPKYGYSHFIFTGASLCSSYA